MSTVVLDTITGKSTATTITIGSTPVVSASANSMTIRGEGTAQTSIQQGLCKHWINLDGDVSGVGARDSFNSSSTTDNGTGNYDSSFTNAMSSDSYMVCGTAASNAPISSGRDRVFQAASETTALMNINIFESSQADQDLTYGASFGDLA